MEILVLSNPPKPVLPCCGLRLTCGQHRELILRYGGIFLDEFSDRGPKDQECARILRYICNTDEGSCLKLVVAGYALESHHLRNILGDHHMVTVTGRKYTMQRCQIDSSGDKDSLLAIASHLALVALTRRGGQAGNVMVFLPGWKEMCKVQRDLMAADVELHVLMLHSEVVGDVNEDIVPMTPMEGQNTVVLSSVIGARSITLKRIKYVIIHPLVRTSSLHASGLTRIRDYLVSKELIGNMAGRGCRDCDGLVTELSVPSSASGHEQPLLDISENASEAILQNLEAYNQIIIWRDRIQGTALLASLPEVPEAARHLVKLRYHDLPQSRLAMCPRLAFFVEEAKKDGVGMEALRIASILERGAGTFDPNEVYLCKEGAHKGCPLLALSDLLTNVPRYKKYAESVATERGIPLMELKIYPRRLEKAQFLWWQSDPKSLLRSSVLTKEEQSALLVHHLARSIPEFVARNASGKWYCSGFRVRGLVLPDSSPSGWILVFNPSEMHWTKQGPDQGQPCLKPTFCCFAPQQPYVATVVCVSDSTVCEDCFLLGLICAWRKAHIFPLWIACKSGGIAEDLCTAWTRAPQTDFGLTIYNGNEFRNRQCNSQAAMQLGGLYEQTVLVCRRPPIFS